MSDFDFDLDFRHSVLNSVEQDNLAKYARQKRVPGIEPGRPLLDILLEFSREKIQRAAYHEHDYLKALKALWECRVVMKDLVTFGHKEFAENIKTIDAGMARIAGAAKRLLTAKLEDPTTSAEDRELIRQFFAEDRR